MSKKKKRDQKIRNNPSGIAFEEALQWLYEKGRKTLLRSCTNATRNMSSTLPNR